MILAAEYIPSPLRLMLGRHSGIGNRIPPIPDFFCRESGRESPIPDSAEKQGIPRRFPIRPGTGIGVPIWRAGGFLVWPRPLALGVSEWQLPAGTWPVQTARATQAATEWQLPQCQCPDLAHFGCPGRPCPNGRLDTVGHVSPLGAVRPRFLRMQPASGPQHIPQGACFEEPA